MADGGLRVVEVLGNAIVGGMETSVRRRLARRPRDVAASVVVPYEGAFARVLRDDGLDVAIVPLHVDVGWSSVHLVAGHASRFRAQVLHAHLPNAHAVAALAGLVAAVPVVATVHGMHLAVADLEAHRLCDSDLLCVSAACATHAAALGIAPHRLHAVRNAAPPPAHAGTRAPGDPFTFAWIGRLSSEKNPELFVRAAARLSDLPVRFAVVGEGPLDEAMRSLAHGLGVGERIGWLGRVEDAASLVRRFDAVVSTSLHEGTPLVLLEAIAAGVPVVATAVGGVPEIVAQGEDGLLVAPGEIAPLEGAMRATFAGAAARHAPVHRTRDALHRRERAFAAYVDDTFGVLRGAASRRLRVPPFRSAKSAGAAD